MNDLQGIVDRMIKNANTRIMLGTHSWREQFMEALVVSAGDDDDDDEEGEEGEEKEPEEPGCMDYVMHILTVPWKLTFATIPPTDYIGGWATFVVAIFMIGVLTAVVGDLASQFGCWVGLKDAVTAISFVALGTSVPDTFASKVSAVQDKYADNAVGNVTGSNAVNVFLGIGIAWSMAAIYHWNNGTKFLVDPGNLGFSVLIFCVEALLCILVLVLRRRKSIGGELGGPTGLRVSNLSVCAHSKLYLSVVDLNVLLLPLVHVPAALGTRSLLRHPRLLKDRPLTISVFLRSRRRTPPTQSSYHRIYRILFLQNTFRTVSLTSHPLPLISFLFPQLF